jgi:hypothetical protein
MTLTIVSDQEAVRTNLDERPTLPLPPVHVIGIIEVVPCMNHLERYYWKAARQKENHLPSTRQILEFEGR